MDIQLNAKTISQIPLPKTKEARLKELAPLLKEGLLLLQSKVKNGFLKGSLSLVIGAIEELIINAK